MPNTGFALEGLASAGHTPESLFAEAVATAAFRLPGLEVVALPGQWLPGTLDASTGGALVLLRVAPGEPGLGCLAALASGELTSPLDLARRGVAVEDGPPGRYAVVVEAGGAATVGRRVTDGQGVMPPDQLLLRVAAEDSGQAEWSGAEESFDGAEGGGDEARGEDALAEVDDAAEDAPCEPPLADHCAQEDAAQGDDAGWAEKSGGPAPRFDGEPEHVPDLTFVVEARVRDDRFISAALAYHRNCGMQPATITSVEHLVRLLAAATTRIGRLRIVTHAHPSAMAVRMFEGHDFFQVNREWLEGFAQGDLEGLRAVLGIRAHFAGWSLTRIVAHVRSVNARLLAPFGYEKDDPPAAGPMAELLFCGADIALVNMGRVTENGAAMPAADRTTLLAVLRAIAEMVGGALVKDKATAADVQRLLDVVSVMTAADFRMRVPPSFDFGADGALNPIQIAGRALDALRRGFRAALTAAQKRFDERSSIDIRGCRVGETSDYLNAVKAFFGNRTAVSGPQWFQYFGECPAHRPTGNAEIRALLATGTATTTARDTQAAFDEWAARSRVDPLHKDFWLDLERGNMVEFCRLAWRNDFPALPFQAPGVDELAALSFKALLARIGELFDVPARAVPSGAALNTLDAFVAGKLAGWMPHLLAAADKATDAQRKDLYAALDRIDGDLGQALVPAATGVPAASDVAYHQRQLIEFLEKRPLAPLRAFMKAVKQRIEDVADPGLHYYMLQIGLPVFLFGKRETLLPGHAVATANNRIVVLDGRADAAYRQWPPLLWAEALPAGHRYGTMRLRDANSTNFAMMVEQANPGTSQVAACPHPDYMDKIRTVR